MAGAQTMVPNSSRMPKSHVLQTSVSAVLNLRKIMSEKNHEDHQSCHCVGLRSKGTMDALDQTEKWNLFAEAHCVQSVQMFTRDEN